MILIKVTKHTKSQIRIFVANEKFNSIPVNFQKNQCYFKVSRANLDQQYACLKKVPIYYTSSSFFVR